ncbi:copper homeostasis protein CutC [Lewinella sp. 4G2]|uniref:copper homeostasis protein CutC n=1 Tax=Lewinella sp. 4G2 TaxID=1803372 RepID=UPI0007B4C3BE|nr:copper homeostasis protein CutC [Lewinella sp. 4G2]OAV45584.1 hypothetical protein A3850_014260 [Lewinella sp. 4G2]
MRATDYTFEVCLQSPEDALEAQRGGAQRLELCAALVEGGITPSLASIQQCRDLVDIDIMVMIRPRGGDFLYSERELEVMHRDIEHCVRIGVTGVVFGVLDEVGNVALPQVQSLVATAGGLQKTFHRAFDVARDPWEALEQLVEVGMDRILTSGQAGTVPEGIALIRELVAKAGNRIGILPGCGITPANVVDVLQGTGATEFHATAFEQLISPMQYRNESVYMGIPGLPEYERQVTSALEVRRFLDAIRGMNPYGTATNA